ncbi:MAG: hypothetical protein KIS68_11590 [Bauldia sp.]|nr:hypothetical protein [Bauldia sp.]
MSDAIDLVISVCATTHAAVWARGAPNILRHIEAGAYTVVVPDDDLPLFRSLTPPGIEVVPESHHVGAIAPLLRAAIPAGSGGRFGWYLQQFIKLGAVIQAPCETVLIWDADAIPLRPLRFLDAAGRLLYYTSHERHDPYFDAIERLLGLAPSHSASFVAQCFPVRTRLARSFAAEVERRSGRPWFEAIIGAIDFSLKSGFSEYETLGTYLAHAHPGGMAFHTGEWLRRGSAAAGGIARFDAATEAWLARRFDHASFEIWDRPYATAGHWRRLGARLRPSRWMR